MKSKKRKYILREAKAILLFAACAALSVTWFSVGYWWYKPVGCGLRILAASFAIGLLFGIIASLHDDYKIQIFIDRKKHWQ